MAVKLGYFRSNGLCLFVRARRFAVLLRPAIIAVAVQFGKCCILQVGPWRGRLRRIGEIHRPSSEMDYLAVRIDYL
jgi:hypothetical protein